MALRGTLLPLALSLLGASLCGACDRPLSEGRAAAPRPDVARPSTGACAVEETPTVPDACAPTTAPTPAPAPADPCAAAVCPAGTRCESARAPTYDPGGNPRASLRPRCVPTAPPATPPRPSRDPCAAYVCPAGYRCTAPADAPYCEPQS